MLIEWLYDVDDYRIFWLNGMAGTGNSTIANSLYRCALSRGMLCTGHFCSRDWDLESARDIFRIFPTVAYQYARVLPPQYYILLAEVSKKKTTSSQATLEQQITYLILTPLKTVLDPLAHLYFIIIVAPDE